MVINNNNNNDNWISVPPTGQSLPGLFTVSPEVGVWGKGIRRAFYNPFETPMGKVESIGRRRLLQLTRQINAVN